MAAELVRWRERSSTRGGGAEDLEEVPRHERTLQPLAIDPDIDVWPLREGIREQARLANERIRLLAGEPLGLRVRRSLTFDREQLDRLRTSSGRKITALRNVNTTATSPRPTATVVTIVRAARGAWRNERTAYRTSRTTLSNGI